MTIGVGLAPFSDVFGEMVLGRGRANTCSYRGTTGIEGQGRLEVRPHGSGRAYRLNILVFAPTLSISSTRNSS